MDEITAITIGRIMAATGTIIAERTTTTMVDETTASITDLHMEKRSRCILD
jgi:hypothetical protein